MKIIINIETCKDCKHSSHSGAFTPGGKLYICRHDKAPDYGPVNGVNIETKKQAKIIFGPRELNKDFSIPSWCPIKNGSKY